VPFARRKGRGGTNGGEAVGRERNTKGEVTGRGNGETNETKRDASDTNHVRGKMHVKRVEDCDFHPASQPLLPRRFPGPLMRCVFQSPRATRSAVATASTVSPAEAAVTPQLSLSQKPSLGTKESCGHHLPGLQLGGTGRTGASRHERGTMCSTSTHKTSESSRTRKAEEVSLARTCVCGGFLSDRIDRLVFSARGALFVRAFVRRFSLFPLFPLLLSLSQRSR
jgi:hypothetical protein